MKHLFNTLLFVLITAVICVNSQYVFAVFTDVKESNTNYDAIKYVEEQGIVSGYPDGTYRPANNINRAELTKIIINSRFSEVEINNCISDEIDSGSSYVFFPDVPRDEWYAKFVCVAKVNDIIGGYPDGTFQPANDINFVEAAKIIVNAFGYEVGTDTVWYAPFVSELSDKSAIPTSVTKLDKSITRGEMAEMIWRLSAELTDQSSNTYSDGKMVVPAVSSDTSKLNSDAPADIVKLIFIHHSTGENWLKDGYGDLGKTLDENNYFVSDTNYGWGPDSIGDRTDIPDWTEWFRSSSTPEYMAALYDENGQNSDYTRTLSDPGGKNEIVMFKSCFPNSELEGSPNDPPAKGDGLTVSNAKYVYNEILKYFSAHPEKLFVVITAPPLSDSTYAANARAFNNWLMDDWLAGYDKHNVAVFDFYNVLTGKNNHHRFNNGEIEHTVTGGNTLVYPSGDDHPSEAGSEKATTEYIPLLNVFYNCWKGTGACI